MGGNEFGGKRKKARRRGRGLRVKAVRKRGDVRGEGRSRGE